MKAIETQYKGYRFRSRLEARWAVFYDACGIPYEYEKEGFEGDDGERYLPDFYLPWFKAYVEIKPALMEKAEREAALEKCKIPFDAEDCIVIFCEGDPVDEKMQVLCNELDDGGGGTDWYKCMFVEGAQFTDTDGIECGYTKHFISLVVGDQLCDRDREFLTSRYAGCCAIQRKCVTGWRSTFEHAKIKARQARFEFGECGFGKRNITKQDVMDIAKKNQPAIYALLNLCSDIRVNGDHIAIKTKDRFIYECLCKRREWFNDLGLSLGLLL